MTEPVPAILIDVNTDADVLQALKDELQAGALIGLDCETQNVNRHAGLDAFCTKKKLVFDHRRTVMTGYSLYVDGAKHSFYLNLAHADAENRLSMKEGLEVLSWINPGAVVLAHNAPFEIVMFFQCLGVELKNVLCTMQMAVSAFGPNQFDPDVFKKTPLVEFSKLAPDVLRSFANYDPTTRGRDLTPDQSEVLGKFISKTSVANHSYRGFARSMSSGYGLKRLVLIHFGYQMATFDETLAKHGAAHMGELTGEQVVDYGADDAFWAVELYKYLRDRMMRENPAALVTFIKQENPMVQVFADAWREGIRLNRDEVFSRQKLERHEMAVVLRKFKADIHALLPFPAERSENLARLEDWYVKHWEKKRQQITTWATSSDSEDDLEQCAQVSNPIGNAWSIELGKTPQKGGLNLTHYHGMRTILYDLLGHRPIKSMGKVASDADARGKILMKYEKEGNRERELAVLNGVQVMADIEQRMKLFVTPYTQLVDPETERVYPTISSKLETRRMAMADPNGMQLAKGGGSAYIRGFYLGDTEDHLVVSADWSSIELVEIGEFSGDPGFAKVFGQLPYGDLHAGAATDCLAVKTLPGLTEEEFKLFKFGDNPNNRELRHTSTGEIMEPSEFFKHARGTAIGKGASFGYWYSGSLSTVGINLGWSSEEMWEAVDRYRTRFAVAEQWRVDLQALGSEQGFVQLPDDHRYVRHEATEWWAREMRNKFGEISASPAMGHFADLSIKRLQSRSRNQIVNAYIQGSCATLAKRSIARCIELCREAGISDGGRVRFMMPVHDETVWSVHKDVVMIFIPLLRRAMTEHPELFKRLPLDCTVALGRTFRPFNKSDPRLTQIELDEAFVIPGVVGDEWQGKKLPDEKVEEVIEWLMAA